MNRPLYNPKDITVLVVDDQDPIRKGIKRVLTSMGIGNILESFDGSDAIKTLGKTQVDLVILDLYMRHTSGFDVLEYIRGRDMASDLPVIVVTGEASKEEIVKSVDLGAEDYMLKPFQAGDLEKKIGKALEKFFSPTPLIKAVRIAERLFIDKDYNNALKAFDRALEYDEKSARAAHGRALTLAKLNRFDEAMNLLQANLELNHSYHRSHGAMADLLLQKNKPQEAIEAMRRELEINPKQANRQVHLAKLLLKEGDAKGAIEHFRVALQENPKNVGGLLGMASAYAHAGQLDKALYYYKRIRRNHPTDTKALDAAVQQCLAANDPRKAELFLKDERQANPERTDTYGILAGFYLKTGREDDALQVANDLLAIDPESSTGLKLKGTLLLKRKDYAGALGPLQKALQVAPSAELFGVVGEALLGQNQMPQAIDALNRSLALDDKNPNSFLSLADAHARSGQWLKASILAQRGLQEGGPQTKAQDIIKRSFQESRNRRQRLRQAS